MEGIKKLFSKKSASGMAMVVALTAHLLVLIGLLSILGQVFHYEWLSGVWKSDYPSPQIIPSIGFMLFGMGIASKDFRQENSSLSRFFTLLIGIFIVFCFIIFTSFTFKLEIIKESFLSQFLDIKHNNLSDLAISVYTILFDTTGVILLLKINFKKNPIVLHLISGIGILITLLGFIGLLGYMYNAPILYNNTFQLPLNSSLGYFLLGISFFCLGGSNTFFTKPFFGTTPSASLLRIFLPLIIAGIIVESLVFIYLHNNDILSPAISMAIITIISILLTTVALTVVSKYVVKRADIAEKARKISEETVLKERILMRTLIDNLPDTIYVKDIHARKILANKADIIAVGLDKESDILGKTDLEVFSEEDGAHGYSQDLQVISTGQAIINHEKEYVHASGKVNWLRTSKIPLKDLDGKIVGLVGIGHDITAAKEVEAQMLLLTHTLKSLNDCVSITDIHDKIIYVNDSFLNTYGYSKEELIGENIRIVRKKDAIEEISENILPATILSGWHGEIVNCKKDGTEFHVEISTSPVLNEAGEIIALSGIATDITERKKMEDALEKSRERYRTLVENQGEGIVIADKNEVVTFANPAAEHIFGFEKGEFVGKNLIDYVTDESIERIKYETSQRSIKNKSSYEIDILTKSGLLKHVLVTATAQKDKTGAHIGAFGILRDITDQKIADQARRKSEEKYRVLVETMPDGVYKRGLDGKFIEVNPALVDLLKYSNKTEVYEQDAIRRFYPKQENRNVISINEDSDEITEYQMYTKVSSFIWVEDHSHKMIDPDDGSVWYEGVIRDVSARKLADIELNNQKEFLETIIESLNHPFYVINVEDYEVKLYNSAAGKYFSGGKKTCFSLTRGIEMPCINMGEKCPLHICVDTGKSTHIEQSYKNPDGEIEVYDVYAYPIFNDHGDVVQIIEYSLNVTERKKIENQLAEQSNQLHELNLTKDKFFSIIAHDLRSPFSAILGLTGLLSESFETLDKESIRMSINEIEKASKKTFSLLENLLEWARSQTGKIEYHPNHFDVAELIELTISSAQANALNKKIDLSSISPKRLEILADKNMIYTILRNLISNALKFTPENGEIIVSAKKRANDIIFYVKDSGVGISQENIDKLFRIDKTYTSYGTNNEKGTGLGLILCKEFIDWHNGKIWIESELASESNNKKSGSTFFFTIPIAQSKMS